MISLPLYTVDAFADSPFTGNQAAVCLVGERPIKESTMQLLAAEMNISETVYISFVGSTTSFKQGSKFNLRWFTPTNEVNLCGHATLASAAILFFECGNVNEEIIFTSLSGELTVKQDKGRITMNFPKNEPVPQDMEKWQNLVTAVVGDAIIDVKQVYLSPTAKKLLIQLDDKYANDELKFITPDREKMVAAHNGSIAKGVILTSKGKGNYDFLSRYFAPWNGIPEDPVTGSAHTVLGPFWSNILKKNVMNARQCSKRGGDLEIKVGEDRVYITGSATVVVKGTVNLPG